MSAPVVAVVDCGTNSTRLLVAAPADGAGPADRVRGGLRILATAQTVTRLGQGVDGNGHLADAAIARTVDAIAGFAETWQRLGADRVRVVATSAVRDAADRDRFAHAVADRVGQALEILSGDEEAEASFTGALGAVDVPRPALILDIGGGSTELIVGDDAPLAATSRQLGCVRLTERCLPGDPPVPAAIAAAQDVIDRELAAAADVIAPHAPVSMVAVAGTATTLGALHAGLAVYDQDRVHGLVLPASALDGLLVRMRGRRAAEIAALGPVQAGREDVLLAGALILRSTLARFGLGEAVISEGDLLDGLCMRTLAT